METKTIFDSDISKLPAYLLFAKLGKKVLRPGGLGFSKEILSSVSLTAKRVLEFAPGRGITAELIIQRNPSEYSGIEHHVDFANQLQFKNPNHKIMVGSMANTELPANSYDVIVGEALLSLQADSSKRQILAEAYRLLKPGGVYLLHELSVVSANSTGGLSENIYQQMLKEMRDTLKVNSTPLRTEQWRNLAQGIGFSIHRSFQRPMALLNRKRMIEDEGFLNVLKIFWNVLTQRGAFKRVRSIVSLFSNYENDLAAIGLILLKPVPPVSNER